MESKLIDKGDWRMLEIIFDYFQSNTCQSILILFTADHGFTEEIIDEKAKKSEKPLLGGIFPGLIFQGKKISSGAMIIGLKEQLVSMTIKEGMDEQKINDKLEQIFDIVDKPQGTLCMFFDALGQTKTYFIRTIFNFFGINMSYVGAGAGSLDFESFPCVISNEGLSQGSMAIAFIPEVKNIGFCHGWTAISDTFKVTKADGNKVQEINHRPAWDIYQEVVSSHSTIPFSQANFFDIAKSYPLGITVMDAEMIVRDLYAFEEDGLMVVDEIKEGEYISVLNGNVESLLKGADNARKIAFRKDSSSNSHSFCIDCISRVLYLGDEFDNELSIIRSDGELSGILSIGEIANNGDAFLEIYNKIIVVLKW